MSYVTRPEEEAQLLASLASFAERVDWNADLEDLVISPALTEILNNADRIVSQVSGLFGGSFAFWD